ncbi:hypothetical protein FA15DRAFT_595487 [Coprinopsis marcescibilis]|uniref:FAD/NAD(P)-binding domain-containing protein n=1 Tax=Coprinopsis marcescibilis TaxID=230819 RepID=A0A5C3L3J0_COPMA|nr:hypothetical protein FA15DRAFT_595487 [Coprinopsis marcescibilis]
MRPEGGVDQPASRTSSQVRGFTCSTWRSLNQQALEQEEPKFSANGHPPTLSSYWRDALALTWNFRTFESTSRITQFLTDRLAQAEISNVQLASSSSSNGSIKDAPPPAFAQLFPDLAWIQFLFTFDTVVGNCQGVVRLVPQVQGQGQAQTIHWKSHVILTTLVALHTHTPLTGAHRFDQTSYYTPPNVTTTKSPASTWDEKRKAELESFTVHHPTVLVIGAGQAGLTLAARFKYLGGPAVSCLLVEKNARVGDNWRDRYDALSLHDPVWYDHLPYLPFPETWPVYTPAKKLGDWLEHYADALELNVWTSSTVESAVQDAKSKLWTVKIRRKDGEHALTVKHVVFASGFVGDAYMPELPGKVGLDKFKGQILHSTEHRSAADHAGKKVLVIGACTSAHDICADYVQHGIAVTMYQRSSTYIVSSTGTRQLLAGLYSEQAGLSTETADLVNMSMVNWGMAGVNRRVALSLVGEGGVDHELVANLEKKGFKTNDGYRGTGPFGLVWVKGGGYYFDFGASGYIVDGRIKVESGHGGVASLSKEGVVFEDGKELEADVVVFCTGLSDARQGPIRRVCGDQVADACSDIWGLSDEGEIRGCWTEVGYEGLWNMMGNLGLCRIYSKHLALRKSLFFSLFIVDWLLQRSKPASKASAKIHIDRHYLHVLLALLSIVFNEAIVHANTLYPRTSHALLSSPSPFFSFV